MSGTDTADIVQPAGLCSSDAATTCDEIKLHLCQGKFKREQMIDFRSSAKFGQAMTRRAKIGSKGFCESPCESGLASG